MAEETPSPVLRQTCNPTPRDQDDVLSIASSFEPPREPPSAHPSPVTSYLTPCSWQDFLQQDFIPEHHVDLVSGFLVRRSVMPDSEHQDIISYLTTLINMVSSLVFAHFTPATKVTDYEEASSSDSPQRKIPGKREPDIALKHRDKESSSSFASPEKKKIKFSGDRPPAAVIEVRSGSTRTEDLYYKWAAYAGTNFPLYVILDRSCARAANSVIDESPRVIVGSLEERMGWELCAIGDPGQSPKKTRNFGRGNRRTAHYYYRKVFKGNQIPDCRYLIDLGLTVRRLLDKRFLLKKIRDLQSQRETMEQEKRDAEDRDGRAEERAGRAEVLLEKERRKRNALERQLKKSHS